MKLTLHGIKSPEKVDTQIALLKLIPLRSGDTKCSTFDVKPFFRKHSSVGVDFIDVDGLNQQDPHLESVLLKRYSYANLEKILGKDMFHVILQLEYFETDPKGTPITVQILLGWVLSGPLP